MSVKIKVCCGNKCKEIMSQYVLDRACDELNLKDCKDGGKTKDGNVEVLKTGCMGKCKDGPNIKIEKNGKEQMISKVNTLKMGNLMNEFKKFKDKD
ncbi:(2Fe-2S) ferredoxin domain-containing protein [Candidatus Gracilibacteria bacterium]|nr:(2Fe-2S) ferredoxin domain-containing protein [Candidatus Gracilibacteria bacterium]